MVVFSMTFAIVSMFAGIPVPFSAIVESTFIMPAIHKHRTSTQTYADQPTNQIHTSAQPMDNHYTEPSQTYAVTIQLHRS